jgi:glycosyltransferase involved in cell wall biosynthesis
MRIAMLGWEFPPYVSGGLGVHCYELTKELARKGIEVDFFLPERGEGIKSSFPNLNIIEVAETALLPYVTRGKRRGAETYGYDLPSAVEKYSKECARVVMGHAAKRRYDLIHAHDWLTAGAGMELKRMMKRPLVQTFHSTEFDRNAWPWDYILGIERKGAAEADRVITVSRRMVEQVKKLGVGEEKIRVVYNGVDATRFDIHYDDSHPHALFKRGRMVVLFLGRLTEQKGPVQFLHAAKKVLEQKKDVLFVMAGSGELQPLLINLAIDLGIIDNVMFLGYVSDEDQKKLYAVSDVYVMPSTSEPFGITVLEAMSSGTPVIISRTAGVGEVVKTALRVDFWDIHGMASKIIAVLSYPSLRKVMSRLMLSEVRSLTWGKAADETIRVYKEVSGMP